MSDMARKAIGYAMALCVVAVVVLAGLGTAGFDEGDDGLIESEFTAATVRVLVDGVSARLAAGASVEDIVAQFERPNGLAPDAALWHLVAHDGNDIDLTVFYQPTSRQGHPALRARRCLTMTIDPVTRSATQEWRICGTGDPE